MKVSNKKILRSLMMVMLVAVCISAPIVVLAYYDSPLNVPAFPKVARASDTSLKLTWHKVSGASGYEVFRYDKAKKKYRNVKTINNGKTVKWTDKKLKTGAKYTYEIRAYKRNGLTKEVSGFTYTISAVPYKKNANIVNAGSELKGASAMTIGIKQKLPVEVAVTPSKYGTAKKKKVIDTNIRVFFDNESHISKSDANNIIGKEVGAADVYAVAHNGNIKKVKVNVVDFAKPDNWMNLDKINENAADVLINQKDDLIAIASYFEIHNDQEGWIELDDNGNLQAKYGNVDIDKLGEIKDTVIRFLSDCPLYATLFVSDEGIAVEMTSSTPPSLFSIGIVFAIQIDEPEQGELGPSDCKIAEHWFYFFDAYREH